MAVVENVNPEQEKLDAEILPPFEPIRFSKSEFDEYIVTFQNDTGGPTRAIAKTLANEVSKKRPGYDYDSLRGGTSTILTGTGFEDGMTDEEVLQFLIADEDGNPVENKGFFSGVSRTAVPALAGSGGFGAGFKAGVALQAPIPPAGPVALIAKGVIPFATGIIGALTGYTIGESAQDAVIGDESPILPDDRAKYEAGKTVMDVAAGVLNPAMIPKKVVLGSAAYLKNLNTMRDSLKASLPGYGFDKSVTGLKKQAGKTTITGAPKDPMSFRFNQAIENFLGKSADEFATNKLGSIYREGKFAVGAGTGAFVAETAAPGSEGVRFANELLMGSGASIAGAPFEILYKNKENIKEAAKSTGRKLTKKGRQQNAVNRIVEILDASDEDVESLIKQLDTNSFSDVLLDEAGNAIPQTAGMQTGSPILLAIEASLSQLGGGLSEQRVAGSIASVNALRSVVVALARSGDQQQLQVAADMAQDIFTAAQTKRLTEATDSVLAAFRQVAGDSPENNMQLSEQLYNVVQQQMKFARGRENNLWKSVEDAKVPVEEMMDFDGNLDVPSFIDEWDSLLPDTLEAKELYTKALLPLNKFVNRKKTEFGLSGELDADGNPIGAIEGATLGTRELTDMRSLSLNLARELRAAGNNNAARMADNFGESLLDTLDNMQGLTKSGNLIDTDSAYNIARSFSRSLNDTFTRAFGGEALAKGKKGGQRIAPELLAQRLFQGGADPTYLRVAEIAEIGSFAVASGLEGAEDAVTTLKGVTLSLLRNARAESFDPETGAISPTALKNWMSKNATVLKRFEGLEADLNNALKADSMLSEAYIANKAEDAGLKGQVTFANLLSGNRAGGTESPTTAVALALSPAQKTPIKQLNNLLDVAQSPEDEILRGEALTGLKSSILEWAFTKGGGTSRTFKPSVLYKTLFEEMPKSKGRVSLSNWMVENNVIGDEELGNLKKYVGEMLRYEAAQADGTLDELVEKAGPILDMYLAITGSVIGTSAQRALGMEGGPGSLVAAGAGAKAMRKLFEDMPESAKIDVMTEVMQNPKLLANLMRVPKTDTEKGRLARSIGEIFTEMGMKPLMRSIPLTASDNEVIVEEQAEPVAPPVAPVQKRPPPPPLQAPPVAQLQESMPPPTPAPAPVAPPTAPSSGPVDRSQYAAMFPNDIASGLINQGIGSMMG